MKDVSERFSNILFTQKDDCRRLFLDIKKFAVSLCCRHLPGTLSERRESVPFSVMLKAAAAGQQLSDRYMGPLLPDDGPD